MPKVVALQKKNNRRVMTGSHNDAGPKHYRGIRGMAKGAIMKLSHRGKIGRRGKSSR